MNPKSTTVKSAIPTLAVLCTVLLGAAPDAISAPVRKFIFSGTINTEGSPFGISMTFPFDQVAGTFTFDAGGSDTQTIVGGITAVVGGATLSADTFQFEIRNDPFPLGISDYYAATAGSGISQIFVDGQPFSGPDNGLFELAIGGNGTADAISSTSLLELDPTVFNTYRQVLFIRETESEFLEADIVLTAVPIPAAVWLFGAAFSFLGLQRRFG